MKKHLLLLMILAAMPWGVIQHAAASTSYSESLLYQNSPHLFMGLCDGQRTTTCTVYEQNAKQLSLASLIPSDITCHYSGNDLVGIRFAIVSKMKIESVTVWVRERLDGPDLVSVNIPKSELVKGWNEIALPQSLPIEGNDLYIGFTYNQTNLAYPASTVLDDRDGGLYIKRDDGEWEDISHKGFGVLSIEGMVCGDHLTARDASLHCLKQSADSIRPNRPLYLSGIIRNDGTMPFQQANINIELPHHDVLSHQIHFDSPLNYRDSARFEITITPTLGEEVSDKKTSSELISLIPQHYYKYNFLST